MATDALYYPWIDPTSKTMLVNSLLYWDKLHTIVPSTVKEPFQNQWSKAAHDYGFLKPRRVDPFSSVVHRASEGFADDLERRAILESVRSVKHLAGNSDQKGYRIYPGKLSPRLMPDHMPPNQRDRIWVNTRQDKDGCLRMRQSYALTYMSRLASEIADEDKVTCYSNQTWSRNVVLDRYVDKDRDHVSENEARLAALSIDAIRIPSHVSLADILRFRESHEDDLKRYRKEIHSLALQVSAAGTEKFQEREIQRIVKERLKPAEREVIAKLGEARIDFGTTVFQVSLASATGLALAAGSLTGALTTLGINLVFSAVKWRTAHARAQKHPLAYLVALRTRFREENTEAD